MTEGNQPTAWQRWARQPKTIWLRRALFQVHLWSGVAVGLYVLMMSVTGSVLVYSNELYNAATPEPIVSKSSARLLTDDQLAEAARNLYPGYRVVKTGRALNPDQAADVGDVLGPELRRHVGPQEFELVLQCIELGPGEAMSFSNRGHLEVYLDVAQRHADADPYVGIRPVGDLARYGVADGTRAEPARERHWRTRSAGAGRDGPGDLVAGQQELAAQPGLAARPGMERAQLAPA